MVSDNDKGIGRPEPEIKLHSHEQSVGQSQQSVEHASIQSSMDKVTEMLSEVLSTLIVSVSSSASHGQKHPRRRAPVPRG